ncbi:porin [Vibrio sp. LaRot3]|uniref:porin n=1 Tax=Vibrio sp. LaRot3 TaxID=2998829 RepID=UPI0022CE28E2|nr:porin [Vibrio sp. LaRot3]MDA0148201.1 porin [Vibrio sp. LaRot3]
MKKTLLALTVATVATSAQAKFDLYKDDVKSVNLKGEIDVNLYLVDEKTKDNIVTKDEDVYVDTWAYFEFGIEHKFSDTVTGFASFEVETSKSDAVFDDVYAGITGDFGTIKGGETADSLSVVGYMTDISNNGAWAYDSNIESKGRGLRYEKSVGDFYFSTDLQTTKDADDEINVGVSYSFEKVTLAAAFSEGGDNVGSAAIGASYENGGFYLAALYGAFEGGYQKVGALFEGADYEKGDFYGLAASYSVHDFRVYTTFAGASDDNSANDAFASSVGIDYTVLGDVTVYAEYTGFTDDAEEQTGDIAVVGVFYAF